MELVTTQTIGLKMAMELLQHILDKASNDGLRPVAICVVDAFGRQLCAATMDGASAPATKTAHDKAVTAINFQRNTAEFGERWDANDVANAMKINEVFVSWGGGYAIRLSDGETIVGAVGVSGRSAEEDHELASQAPASWFVPWNK